MISPSTKLYGLIGYPLGHSISFYIHNAAFRALSIDALYLNIPIEPEFFSKAILGIKYLPIYGLNVTIPHKESIIEFLDEISEISNILGAVNTVYRENHKWKGDNTDFGGFLKTLENLNLSRDFSCLILGAGGAARAVIYAVLEYGFKEVYLTNRTYERAEKIAVEVKKNKNFEIKVIPWEDREKISEKVILINTTSIGLDGKETPWNGDFKKLVFVYDIIYNPKETPLLKLAKENNVPYKNGLDMLIYQACLSWEKWFGFVGPFEVMKREAEKLL
ncbi:MULTISPECIES: shikimate dehydrogenase [Dictyoglomus]|uniref:shikimate dehydrogenase n=1 Tax=Dictyoglomus TaxID=13 RepID=UPI0023536762|nr:shikimate dehydrogenase [Dictyoglomus turgidum]